MTKESTLSSKEGIVYLLYDGVAKLSKIGCTTRQNGRRQQAIMGGHGAILVNVLNIKVADCFEAEAQCHKHFDQHRRNGEWFAVSYEDAMTYMLESIDWQEMDLANQARLGKYLLAANCGNYKLMRQAIKGPDSPYFGPLPPPPKWLDEQRIHYC